jgi:hypothetical protein
MEDIGSSPLESKETEIWIYQQAKTGKQPSYIADELLKHWEKGSLTLDGKATVSRYCISNGFFPSLVRIFRNDLAAGRALPWEHALEVLVKNATEMTPEFTEAFLCGVNRDGRGYQVAAMALFNKSKDARWEKIIRSKVEEVQTRAKNERNKILSEMKIFKNEGMRDEIKASLTRILTLFPDDSEATKMERDLNEGEIEKTLQSLRTHQEHRNRSKNSSHDESSEWPELKPALERIKPKLDLEGAYHLSIGLQAMGLFAEALDVLRGQKENWTLNEHLQEVELLLKNRLFAEALQRSQMLLRQHAHDPDCVQAALYLAAKSYRGLEDLEQAIGIMRGLLNNRPDYRDASLLLTEWEGELR